MAKASVRFETVDTVVETIVKKEIPVGVILELAMKEAEYIFLLVSGLNSSVSQAVNLGLANSTVYNGLASIVPGAYDYSKTRAKKEKMRPNILNILEAN